MKYYVGITIGPIFDTIDESSTPAALWFSSTLFSDITRRVCIGIEPFCGELYSPAFDEKDRNGLSDGVGKYHDRIIFSAVDGMSEEEVDIKLRDVVESVKEDTILCFRNEDFDNEAYRTFLKQYLQIHYCILDEAEVGDKNCVLTLSQYLDSLELMKSFPVTNENNPIRAIMSKPREEAGSSYYVKRTALFQNTFGKQTASDGNPDDSSVNWLVDEQGNIRDIVGIASGKKAGGKTTSKYENYYVVVNADADGMGAFLNSISTEAVTRFSGRCLEYSKLASKMVNDFGGMTIYAGGDDLLFLSPVAIEIEEDGQNEENSQSEENSRPEENRKPKIKTVFQLCDEIGKCFRATIKEDEEFSTNENVPTVSFGLAIQYKSYPLYEARRKSYEMLQVAKNTFEDSNGKSLKNCLAVNLEKHSGQSTNLVYGFDASDVADQIMELPMKHKGQGRFLQSVMYRLEDFYAIFSTMDANVRSGEPCYQRWDNLFDNEGQAGAAKYLEDLNSIYYEKMVKNNARIQLPETTSKERPNASLNALIALLRISKFLMEGT